MHNTQQHVMSLILSDYGGKKYCYLSLTDRSNLSSASEAVYPVKEFSHLDFLPHWYTIYLFSHTSSH